MISATREVLDTLRTDHRTVYTDLKHQLTYHYHNVLDKVVKLDIFYCGTLLLLQWNPLASCFIISIFPCLA